MQTWVRINDLHAKHTNEFKSSIVYNLRPISLIALSLTCKRNIMRNMVNNMHGKLKS